MPRRKENDNPGKTGNRKISEDACQYQVDYLVNYLAYAPFAGIAHTYQRGEVIQEPWFQLPEKIKNIVAYMVNQGTDKPWNACPAHDVISVTFRTLLNLLPIVILERYQNAQSFAEIGLPGLPYPSSSAGVGVIKWTGYG